MAVDPQVAALEQELREAQAENARLRSALRALVKALEPNTYMGRVECSVDEAFAARAALAECASKDPPRCGVG